VDPYSYRAAFTLSKLFLLDTNDPCWTVESLHLYGNDLPSPIMVYQSPNADFTTSAGNDFRLSTQVQVTPDAL